MKGPVARAVLEVAVLDEFLCLMANSMDQFSVETDHEIHSDFFECCTQRLWIASHLAEKTNGAHNTHATQCYSNSYLFIQQNFASH